MKHFYKYLSILCLILCCSLLPVSTVEASGIKQIEGLTNQTTGPAKYMQDMYRDNYSLDVDKVGLLDGLFEVFNGIANVIFSMVKFIAYAAICFFYHSLTFDVTTTFSDELNAIQSLLRNSIFEPLLLLGFFFSGITILKRFLQQNMVGILSEFCKVIVLILISILLVKDSKTILTTTSAITKSISLSAFTGVNSLENDAQTTLQNYAIIASGILWQNMVHEPWKALEFGNTDLGEDGDLVGLFLSYSPGSEERENLVAKYANTQAFSKGRVFTKIGNCLIYLIVIAIKSILYIAVAGIMFTYQIFSIFYLLIAPLILILAFFPSYHSIVNVWFKKFVETQVCIFIITLVLGLIVKLDSIIFKASGDLGWFMALIFQIATIFFLYKERDKIIHAFSNVQKAIEVPAYANALLRNRMNVQNLPRTVSQVKNLPNAARETLNDAQNAAAHTKAVVTGVATRVSLGMHGMGWTKSGMEKKAEEASVHDTMQKIKLQHERPDLYKAMQKQEQEKERMKDHGPIQLRMAAANKTLDEIRTYEREKEKSEKAAKKSERATPSPKSYSNIINFEDRPRLRSQAAAPQAYHPATVSEAIINMRTDDEKSITAQATERPVLNRNKNYTDYTRADNEAHKSSDPHTAAIHSSPKIPQNVVNSLNSADSRINMQTEKETVTNEKMVHPSLVKEDSTHYVPQDTANPSLKPDVPIRSSEPNPIQNSESNPTPVKRSAAAPTAQAVTAKNRQNSTPKHVPKAAGSFTAIEANTPLAAKKTTAARPKLNTGQYKSSDSSDSKKKTITHSKSEPPKITNAKKVSK